MRAMNLINRPKNLGYSYLVGAGVSTVSWLFRSLTGIERPSTSFVPGPGPGVFQCFDRVPLGLQGLWQCT